MNKELRNCAIFMFVGGFLTITPLTYTSLMPIDGGLATHIAAGLVMSAFGVFAIGVLMGWAIGFAATRRR